MNNYRVKIWPYVVSFIVFGGMPLINLVSIDFKHVLFITVFALIGALVFGTIVNFAIYLFKHK